MLKTKLTVVISSVLLAAAATQAQPAPTEQAAEPTAPAQSSAPTDTSSAKGADTSTDGNASVGTPDSNADKDSTSGAYYPYSAGTVGDDPAEPAATAAPPANGGEATSNKAAGATDQWQNADTDGDGYLSQDELKKVAPALADSFGDIDVDGDDKLTRAEFRTWHQSQKARMDADEGSSPSTASPPAAQTPASGADDTGE